MKKNLYQVRWYDRANLKVIANVDVRCGSGNRAISSADKLGRKLGLPASRRTIHCGTQLIHEKP